MTSYVGVYQGDPGIKNCPPEALLSQPWYMGWMLHLPAGFVILRTLVWIIRATGPKFVLARKKCYRVYVGTNNKKKIASGFSKNILVEKKPACAPFNILDVPSSRSLSSALRPFLCNFWHPQIHRKDLTMYTE
jgi:hypothetical protein